MSSFSLTSVVAAPILCGAAIFLLRRAWSKQASPKLIAIALLFLLASIALLRQVVGLEFAIAYSFIIFSVLAWVLIALTAEYKAPKAGSLKISSSQGSALWPKLRLFLLAGPVALLASVCWTLLLSRLMPVLAANQMVIAAFLFPVCWASLMAWVCMAADERRAGNQLLVMAGLGAMVFYWVPVV